MMISVLEEDVSRINNQSGKSFNIFGYKVITTGKVVASVSGIAGIKFVTLWGRFE